MFDESSFPYSSLFHISSSGNHSSDFQYNLLKCYTVPVSSSNQDTLEANTADNDHYSPLCSSHNIPNVSSPSNNLHTDSLHCSSLTQSASDLNTSIQPNNATSIPNQQNPSSSPVETHQSPIPTQVKPLISTHKMITRAKAGIFKPKAFIANHNSLEPSTTYEALSDPKWKEAMQAEYDALMKKNTWSLVLISSSYKPVGCKWVFRTKYNTDGSVSKYKQD